MFLIKNLHSLPLRLRVRSQKKVKPSHWSHRDKVADLLAICLILFFTKIYAAKGDSRSQFLMSIVEGGCQESCTFYIVLVFKRFEVFNILLSSLHLFHVFSLVPHIYSYATCIHLNHVYKITMIILQKNPNFILLIFSYICHIDLISRQVFLLIAT